MIDCPMCLGVECCQKNGIIKRKSGQVQRYRCTICGVNWTSTKTHGLPGRPKKNEHEEAGAITPITETILLEKIRKFAEETADAGRG
jgi:hypothetical protein